MKNMESKNKIKCGNKQHQKIDANIYCQKCNIYICVKNANNCTRIY